MNFRSTCTSDIYTYMQHVASRVAAGKAKRAISAVLHPSRDQFHVIVPAEQPRKVRGLVSSAVFNRERNVSLLLYSSSVV